MVAGAFNLSGTDVSFIDNAFDEWRLRPQAGVQTSGGHFINYFAVSIPI